MRRIFGIGAALFGAVLLAGCSGQSDGMADQARDQVREQDQAQAPERVIDDVTGWVADLAAGKRLECEYRIDDAEATGTVRMIMDRDRYRTETETPNGTFISVFDGETMYSWTAGGPQGMKMSRKCMDDMGGDVSEEEEDVAMPEEGESYDSSEEALGAIPGISCREISGADFSVPVDVEFVDQCQMLQEQTRAMEQYRDQMPDDVRGMMQ